MTFAFAMNRRYSILLLILGANWFLIAVIVGYAFNVLLGLWLPYFVSAIVTAFVVGIAFRVPILRWSGWRWYLLPLLTLLTGTAVFGFLLACSLHLTELLRGEGGLECDTFYIIPFWSVYLSMTGGLPVLYPLALLTQHLLRRGTKIENAEPATAPNGGPAIPPANSRATEGPPSVS